MPKIVTFPQSAVSERQDAIEFEMIGFRRSLEALELANDGEQYSALRAYHLEHLTEHYQTLHKLLYPRG